jgi:hypothetical protein
MANLEQQCLVRFQRDSISLLKVPGSPGVVVRPLHTDRASSRTFSPPAIQENLGQVQHGIYIERANVVQDGAEAAARQGDSNIQLCSCS